MTTAQFQKGDCVLLQNGERATIERVHHYDIITNPPIDPRKEFTATAKELLPSLEGNIERHYSYRIHLASGKIIHFAHQEDIWGA